MSFPDEIVPLVSHNDNILREEMPEFDFLNPPYDPHEVESFLARHLVHYRGMGLAASQLGYRLRAFVLGNPDEPQSICSAFNPTITWQSEEMSYSKEGCLSFPDLLLQIKRPRQIRVKYQDCYAEIHTEVYRGITARIIQHEVDHLNGILFTSYAGLYHYQKGLKKAKLARRMKKLNLKVVDGGK